MPHQLAGYASNCGEVVAGAAEQAHGDHGHWGVVQEEQVCQGHGGQYCERGKVVARGAEPVHGEHGHWDVVQDEEVGQWHGGHQYDLEHRDEVQKGEQGHQVDRDGQPRRRKVGTVPTNSAPVATSSRGEKYARRTRSKFRKGVQPVEKNLTIWRESRSL